MGTGDERYSLWSVYVGTIGQALIFVLSAFWAKGVAVRYVNEIKNVYFGIIYR